jgi:hypothetical protein
MDEIATAVMSRVCGMCCGGGADRKHHR